MAERSFNGRNLYTPNIDGAVGGIVQTGDGWLENSSYGVSVDVFGLGSASYLFDSTVQRTGRLTIKLNKIDTTAGVNARIRCDSTNNMTAANAALLAIPVRPQRTYKFSCYVKTENAGVSQVNALVREFANSGTGIISHIVYAPAGTNDWNELTVTFTTRVNTTYIGFGLVIASGVATAPVSAWFDINSIQLLEVIPTRTTASPRLSSRFMGGSTVFNGTTSTIPTTLTDNSDFTSGFVLHGWIMPRSRGESTGRIFDKSSGISLNNGFGLYMNVSSDQLRVIVNSGTGVNSATGSVILNRWHHVVCHVASNATVSFYIDGQPSGTPGTTGALSGITTTNPLTIGNRSGATDRTFDGNLAELGIISLAGRGDLTTEEIQNLYLHSVQPEGAVNFWKLDEQPSNYVDILGGATGTGSATSSSPDTPTQARVALRAMGTALSFDGVDDFVFAPAPDCIVQGGAWTLDLWVNTFEYGDGFIFASRQNTTDRNIAMGWRASTNRIEGAFFTDGAPNIYRGRFATPAGLLQRNRYYKITLVYDGTPLNEGTNGVKLYVDSREQPASSQNIGGAGNENRMTFGSQTQGANYLQGIIDEPRIWNRALSAQEISDLYFNNIVPRDGLVAEYLFNEGSGDTVLDTSGNGNHGTRIGATYTNDVPLKLRSNV